MPVFPQKTIEHYQMNITSGPCGQCSTTEQSKYAAENPKLPLEYELLANITRGAKKVQSIMLRKQQADISNKAYGNSPRAGSRPVLKKKRKPKNTKKGSNDSTVARAWRGTGGETRNGKNSNYHSRFPCRVLGTNLRVG